jgi:hypothetical protein
MTVATQEPDTSDKRQRIKELFLQRQPSYRLSEAARLIGVSRGVLRREAEADQREAYRSNGSWSFSWRQVTCNALRRWSLAEIHEALGTEAATVLPPLLALRALTVRLPEYLVRAVETMAAEDATTVDDWLQQDLVDFAGTVVDRMEQVVPGFRRAYVQGRS